METTLFNLTVAALRYALRHVDNTHGLDHALAVHRHCRLACETVGLAPELQKICEMAALLHDADDRKYHLGSYESDGTCNYRNARSIMKGLPDDFQTQVLDCISVVSYSSNGDSKTYPKGHSREGELLSEWMLYPRYADRLEASGEIGHQRCLHYNEARGDPVIHPDTPTFRTREEVYEECRRRAGEYQRNRGASRSVIDHYYDKLIPLSLALCENSNLYFRERFQEKHEYDMQVVLTARRVA
jgi:hypothetical protein